MPGRLVGLRSLVLAAGFFQEISGLPASLASLRLDRNVVYVRLLGARPHRNLALPVRSDQCNWCWSAALRSACSRVW